MLVLEVVPSPCFPIKRIHFLWLMLLSGSNMSVTAHPGSGVVIHLVKPGALLREQDRALSVLGYDVI